MKHKESRRPSSWREETITRTKEEALEILEGLENFIIVFIEFYVLFFKNNHTIKISIGGGLYDKILLISIKLFVLLIISALPLHYSRLH